MARSVPGSKLNLNLLFPQGVAQKLPVKFLRWLITYGRFLAIVVEIIVLITFALRFKLDDDLSNVEQKINLQIPYIASLEPNEALIRQTQFKLSRIKTTYSQNVSWHTTLSTIAAQEPQGISVASINLSHETAPSEGITFKISGTSPDVTDLAIFLGGLKKEPTFQNINLTSINFNQGQITFTISGETK